MSSIVKSTRPTGRQRPQGDGDRAVASGTLPVYRLSVDQYEKMADAGVLTTEDRVELIEGILVRKMTQHPPHAVAIDYTLDVLRPLLPEGWRLREQKPIKLSDSVPEPDIVVLRGPLSLYERRHPEPKEIAIVIEVADSSLETDRHDKGRMYARTHIPIYWIINLDQRQLEAYTEPRSGKSPAYRRRTDYGIDTNIDWLIEGRAVAQVPVRSLLPSTNSEVAN
jgi:hypothetical protein